MPKPENRFTERHEVFCRHMARGSSGTAAARWAGFSPHNASKQAADMLARPHIRNRIEELKVRREAARQTGIADVVDRLRVLATLSTEKQDYRTAVRCIEIEARICGLLPDRNAAAVPGGFTGADPLLDGIDPRHPDHIEADTAAWADHWRAGPTEGPEDEPEPEIVPHVYEGFDGRPRDEFTPYTDLIRSTPRNPHKTPAETTPRATGNEEDEDEPDRGGVEPARSARATALFDAEMAYLRSIAPPVAINPAAPAWARHPDPLTRGAQAELSGGWNPDWEKPG